MSTETEVWQQNIKSGVVFNLAQGYENRGQLLQALVLYIKAFDFYYNSTDSLEVGRFIQHLKLLQATLGEAQFLQVWRAVTGSIADAFLIDGVLLRIVAEQIERLGSPTVEHQNEPDEEFLQVWQIFWQSIQEQLAIGLATDEQEADASLNPYREDFSHLHLPSASAYIEPKWLTEELELQKYEDIEQALEDGNPYAFFRYLKTLKNHTAPVYAVTFCPDGQTLVSGSADTTIKLWSLSTGHEFRTLTGHTNAVISVAVSPDGQTLVSGSADTTIKLWSLSTGHEIRTLTGHTNAVISVAVSPDGQTLVSGSADTTIKLWSLSTGHEIRTLTGHTNAVISVAVSPDGQTLVSGSADTTIKLWSLSTGHEIRTLTGHISSVLCVAISADGKFLASSSADTTIKLWDLQTGEQLSILDADSGFVFGICFHPHQQLLTSTHSGPGAERTVNLWHLNTLEINCTIAIYEEVVSVKVSPDGQVLATVGGSETYEHAIVLWNLNTGKAAITFESNSGNSSYHQNLVYCVAFSPSGQMLASGARDNTIKLWGIPQPINIE